MMMREYYPMIVPITATQVKQNSKIGDLFRLAAEISDMGGNVLVEDEVDSGPRIAVVLWGKGDQYCFIPAGYWICCDRGKFFTLSDVDFQKQYRFEVDEEG